MKSKIYYYNSSKSTKYFFKKIIKIPIALIFTFILRFSTLSILLSIWLQLWLKQASCILK